MAITVSGTTITFNDGTTQTTAGGAPTTAQVLSATAGASVGAVGTYALLWTSLVRTAGGTLSGNQAYYASGGGGLSGQPSGTWRCMGFSSTQCYNAGLGSSVYLRIS